MQKLRIGILMGGRSSEKEVSFNSGRTVCDHLDSTLYDIVPIFQTTDGTLYRLPWHFLHRGKTTDFVHRLSHEATTISWDQLAACIDFLYIAQHGRYAEDGILQGTLEVLGIPYLGSGILASALGMDKHRQKAFLRMHNIAVASDLFLSEADVRQLQTDGYEKSLPHLLSLLESASITFPCVIKPQHEGSSLGISVVHEASQLYPAIMKAVTADEQKMQGVLIEEKIEGTEFTCVTITDYKMGKLVSLPPTEIVPELGTEFFTYDQKYMPGRATKFTPARLSSDIIEKIQQTCIAVMQALGITSLSRIDGIVTKQGTVVIIDPNTFAGISPSSFIFNQAAEINMSHTQLINHLIETELHTHNLKAPMHNETTVSSSGNARLRVAVLMGGASNEREISLESGRNVFYKLSPYQYESYPLFVDDHLHLYELPQSLLVRNSTKEIAQSLEPSMRWSWQDLKKKVDFVFIGLHGGLGENGGVQGMLEMLDLPYNGSDVLTSALCMDKFKTNSLLQHYGISTPINTLVTRDAWTNNAQEIIDSIGKKFTLPLIVKPHDDGCSVMVQKVSSIETVPSAIQHIFDNGKSAALVEEYIMGMELTVGVLGNENPKVLPPSQTVVSKDVLSIEEKFLPGAGENQTPAPLPPATIALVQEQIRRVYTTLGCKGYARIDCFYQNATQSPTGIERVVMLEVNTLPGLTPATCIFHQAAEIGLRPMEFIDQIIQFGLQAHQQVNNRSITPHSASTASLSL